MSGLVAVHRSWLCDLRNMLNGDADDDTTQAVRGYLAEVVDGPNIGVCSDCRGTGIGLRLSDSETWPCRGCEGTGIRHRIVPVLLEKRCPICWRDGVQLSSDPNCPRCEGTGYLA
jgi:DnaJ-class molecular chaperone